MTRDAILKAQMLIFCSGEGRHGLQLESSLFATASTALALSPHERTRIPF